MTSASKAAAEGGGVGRVRFDSGVGGNGVVGKEGSRTVRCDTGALRVDWP